jgi:Peptidase C13 family
MAFATNIGTRRAFALLVAGLMLLPMNGSSKAQDDPAEAARIQRLYAQAARLDTEAIFYGQAKALENALATIAQGTGGKRDLFFLGVAGDGYQDVFLSEVQIARDAVIARYGADVQSLLLVNNLRTVNRYPLASSTNMTAAIKGLAARMNLSEDVLLLFITSHGNPDATISTQLPGFSFTTINARTVRKALDAAGIANRIIIVSACYSGSFVPILATPGSLVMTAAAADRTSFGCSNERSVTYFGDALLQQSLPSAPSLPEAFRTALGLIDYWESRDGLTPSKPQLHLGTAMAPVLADLEKARR